MLKEVFPGLYTLAQKKDVAVVELLSWRKGWMQWMSFNRELYMIGRWASWQIFFCQIYTTKV